MISVLLSLTLVFSFATSSVFASTPSEEMLNEWEVRAKEFSALIAEYEELTPAEIEELAIMELAKLKKTSVEEVKLELSIVSDLQPFIYVNDAGYVAIDSEQAMKSTPQHSDYIRLIEAELQTSGESVEHNSINILAASHCNGENSWNDGVIEKETLFDSCVANQIVAAINIAASVATMAAIVTAAIFPPAALGTAVAAALLNFSAGVVALAASNGCGIKVSRWLFLPWKVVSQC